MICDDIKGLPRKKISLAKKKKKQATDLLIPKRKQAVNATSLLIRSLSKRAFRPPRFHPLDFPDSGEKSVENLDRGYPPSSIIARHAF